MNKNFRRSLVIAAGVSGAWALGSAVASADELPAHSVSVPDRPAGEVADVLTADTDDQAGTGAAHRTAADAHTVTGAADRAVHTAVGDVARTAHGTVAHVLGAAAHVQSAGPQTGSDTSAAEGATAGAEGTAGSVAAGQEEGAEDAVAHARGAAQGEIDYLFGPLSAFAPELAADTGQTARSVPAAAPAAAEPGRSATPADRSVAPTSLAPTSVAHTTAAPAGQAAAPGEVLDEVISGLVQTPPIPEAAGALTEVAAALQKNLPDPARPGSPTYTALQVVGDALYIVDGVKEDVGSLRMPDSVPQDTLRLVENLVDGLGGQTAADGR